MYPTFGLTLRKHAYALCRDFKGCKIIIYRFEKKYFSYFAQNIDCWYASTHNLCFGANLRK